MIEPMIKIENQKLVIQKSNGFTNYFYGLRSDEISTSDILKGISKIKENNINNFKCIVLNDFKRGKGIRNYMWTTFNNLQKTKTEELLDEKIMIYKNENVDSKNFIVKGKGIVECVVFLRTKD